MKRIWKYQLKLTASQSIQVPCGAQFLSTHLPEGHLCIWALVDESAEKEERVIVIAGTGHPVDLGSTGLTFLGTVLMADGALVWHVFVRTL